MSHRIEKVESTLQRTVSEVIQRRISDPRIGDAMVSITRVKVTPDLREAVVYASIMPEARQSAAMKGLHHAAGRIRALVRKSVALRTMPSLRFELDESLKEQARVYQAIDRAMDRTGLPDDSPDGADEDTPGDAPPDSTR